MKRRSLDGGLHREMVRDNSAPIRLLSRSSALAVLQARLVEAALRARFPHLTTTLLARSSAGDRDRRTDLSRSAEKGLFTADLSHALVAGEADAVIHSWKDLPIVSHDAAVVASTLERADPRDVLLVRRAVAGARPGTLSVLSSSPRRAWQIESEAPALLPWRVTDVQVTAVRGNVPTRLAKLVRGEGDALIVAKAALDRLLADEAPGDAAATVRAAIDACHWMVLPIKSHPTAPAQGALAIEVAKNRPDLFELFASLRDEATWTAVHEERQVLESFGGGCSEAIGATVLARSYGRVTSVRARLSSGTTERWTLEPTADLPRAAAARIWPRPEERGRARRHPLPVAMPADTSGFWVARAEALPDSWTVTPDRLIWAAGPRTWERLARRGVWVHGSAEGLGDEEPVAVDALAGRSVAWTRLTHSGVEDPRALATYLVDERLPDDLGSRSHFFWTSGTAFTRALSAHPGIAGGWHASGPGRTARAIRETLGNHPRISVWLDYEQWHQHVTS
jgi:hydroxymethylbilane synthase